MRDSARARAANGEQPRCEVIRRGYVLYTFAPSPPPPLDHPSANTPTVPSPNTAGAPIPSPRRPPQPFPFRPKNPPLRPPFLRRGRLPPPQPPPSGVCHGGCLVTDLMWAAARTTARVFPPSVVRGKGEKEAH